MTTSGRPPESKQTAGAQPPRRRAAMTRFALEAGAGAVLVVAAAAILFGGAGDWAALLLFVTAALALAVCGRRQATALRRVERLQRANQALAVQAKSARRLNDDLLLALADAIDLRQPEATGRSPSAAHFAALTAQEMGLPPERVELLRRAGLVHDIGKLTVPEMLLFKPNGLTAEERRLVQDHAAAGADLLGEYDALQEIAPFVRHHHERYDGQGYPDGLAGEAIPLEARILALSDAAAALAASRSFRRTGLGEGLGAVVAALEAQAGTRFDPAAVAAFARAIQRQEWQRQESPAFAGDAGGTGVRRRRRARLRSMASPAAPCGAEAAGLAVISWPQVDWPRTAA